MYGKWRLWRRLAACDLHAFWLFCLFGFLGFWVFGILATLMERAVTCTWDKVFGREGKERWKGSGLNGTSEDNQ